MFLQKVKSKKTSCDHFSFPSIVNPVLCDTKTPQPPDMPYLQQESETGAEAGDNINTATNAGTSTQGDGNCRDRGPNLAVMM